MDGFELQLNNYPRYFHPDEVKEGIEVMTDWIGRVHEAVKKSGQIESWSSVFRLIQRTLCPLGLT